VTLRETVQYQPASHYWLIQAVEAAIFLGAAAVFVTIAVLAVTKRRAV
jgi:DhnA family fructose-bisphosphate aldolase class Ia